MHTYSLPIEHQEVHQEGSSHSLSYLNLKTIQWDVDSLDWKGISGEEICQRIITRVKNGSIILCHNNSDHILEALPLVLDRLKKQGYKITSVGDLIYQDNYEIDRNGMQKSLNNAETAN